MWPQCIAVAAAIVVAATSTGGLASLVVRKLLSRTSAAKKIDRTTGQGQLKSAA